MEKQDDITITLDSRDQKRLSTIEQVQRGQLTVKQAAARLDMSERQVYRLKAAFERESVRGLLHRNRGRPAQNRIREEERRRILLLATTAYAGANRNHLRDLLREREGIMVSVPSLRRILLAAGVQPATVRRAPKHRVRRDRMSQQGMLLQLDASRHHWFGTDQPPCALLAMIDDATGSVPASVFREQEDAHGYLLLLREVLLRRGIPLELYHDGHSVFVNNERLPLTLDEELAGQRQPTQFGRALQQLGIISIRARSPQAKGRIERLWGTCQDRLVKELAFAGITDLETANAFLPDYFERHDQRFAVSADDPGLAYRPLDPTLDLQRILSFAYERTVANDNTVRFEGGHIQIPADAWRRSYAKATVTVHQLLDGSIGIWYQDRWLFRSQPSALPLKLRPLKHPTEHRRRSTVSPPLIPPPLPDQITLPPTPPAKKRPKPASNHPWRVPRLKDPD